MKHVKENVLKVISIISIISLPIFSFAEEAGKIINPLNESTIDGLIKTVLEGALKIGIPIIALAIIYCGFLFVEARGNPEKIGKAKESLMYTLVGAGILLGAWAIALLIKNTVLAL